MATSRTPVSNKTTTKKSATATAALPASTAKAPPKAAPKVRSKATAAPSAPPATRTKQAKLTPDASATKKPRATRKPAVKQSVTSEERYQMIVTAAYFQAERHGFSSGRAMEDWLAAEKEIDQMLQAAS